MEKEVFEIFFKKVLKGFSILLIGFCLGDLIGLSNSPTITSVIGILLLISAAFLSISIGEKITLGKAKLAHFLLLTLGLTLGSHLGMYIKVNDIGGLNPNVIKNRWEAIYDTLPSDFNKTLFQSVYGTSISSDHQSNNNAILPINHSLQGLSSEDKNLKEQFRRAVENRNIDLLEQTILELGDKDILLLFNSIKNDTCSCITLGKILLKDF